MTLSREYQRAWLSKHPLYPAWQSMRRNCGVIKGASEHVRSLFAGVNLYREWIDSYAAFEKWALVNGWKPGMQVARIDKSGDCCPSNCIVTTWDVNVNMRRNTIRVGDLSLRDYIGRPTSGRQDVEYRLISDRYMKCKWDADSSIEMPKMTCSQAQSIQARARCEK